MYDTQPAEYFFLTSIYDSGFSCDTRFIHAMWMCSCNSFGSFWFFFSLLGLFLSSNLVVTGWSGGVLNFIFRHRCIHTYIEMKMWRNRLFLCYELVFAYTLFSFFTPFLRFVETCVHTKSCISILKYGFPCLNVCETVLLFVAKKRNKKNVLCVLKHANRLKALIMYFPT